MDQNRNAIKYTAVKHDIYNPEITSLRRIELDNQLGKLSDEHCRNVLPPGLEELPKELFYQYYPQIHHVEGYNVLPLDFKKWNEEQNVHRLSFLNNEKLAESWEKFKDGLPVSYLRLVNMPSIRDYRFKNYVLRYINPERSSSWRLNLRSFKNVDFYSQMCAKNN